MENEIKNIPNLEATCVVSFGNEKNNCLVIETVGSFINMMNYLNTKIEYEKIEKDGVTVFPINFEFDKSREYKLVYSQVLKIVIDGKEVDKTYNNFNKVLNYEKDIFEKALNQILEKSINVGFTLSTKTGFFGAIARL